jgi:hypothetical protein
MDRDITHINLTLLWPDWQSNPVPSDPQSEMQPIAPQLRAYQCEAVVNGSTRAVSGTVDSYKDEGWCEHLAVAAGGCQEPVPCTLLLSRLRFSQ